MRIVTPGTVVREQSQVLRRTRLARLICATIVVGWAATALVAVLAGAAPSRNAWLLVGVGVLTGVTWAARRWDRHGDCALQILLVAASLEAAAATLAFDRGAIVAGPVFALMLAPLVGLVGCGPRTFALQVAVLAGGQLVVAAWGPQRSPDAVAVGVVAAVTILAIAAAAAAIAAARARSQRMRRLIVDARVLHQRLAEALAADPERLALLTLDLGGLDRAGRNDLQEALAGEVLGRDVVARSGDDVFSILARTDGPGAEALARRIQAAVSAYHHDEIAALNASIGIVRYPQDGRTPDELLASADAALAERRAAPARVLRIVSPAAR